MGNVNTVNLRKIISQAEERRDFELGVVMDVFEHYRKCPAELVRQVSEIMNFGTVVEIKQTIKLLKKVFEVPGVCLKFVYELKKQDSIAASRLIAHDDFFLP